jgi:tripartite-type tricarboxylate transporter receptor subunit TctC
MIRALAFFLAAIFCQSVLAWEPSRPVTVVIAHNPGSGNELLFRKLDTIISRRSNVKFVYDFRPGAYELLGMNHFSQQPADGHTLYVPGISIFVGTSIWFRSQLRQDPLEWEPVISIGESPIALIAHTDSTVNNPAEFVAALRSGRNVDIGTGAATFALAYEIMVRQAGSSAVQKIQYNVSADAMRAVAGKEIEFALGPLSSAMPLVKAGRAKIVGVTGSSQSAYPNLASEFRGLDLVPQNGIVLPTGTPRAIVNYYQQLFQEAMATQEYQDHLLATGWYDSLRTPEAYRQFLVNQRRKWQPISETIRMK